MTSPADWHPCDYNDGGIAIEYERLATIGGESHRLVVAICRGQRSWFWVADEIVYAHDDARCGFDLPESAMSAADAWLAAQSEPDRPISAFLDSLPQGASDDDR